MLLQGFMLILRFHDDTAESVFGQSLTVCNGQMHVQARDLPGRSMTYPETAVKAYSLQPYAASVARLDGLIIEAKR